MAIPHPALIRVAAGEEVGELREVDAFLDSAAEHRMTGLVWTQVDRGRLDVGAEHHQALFEADIAHWAHNARLWSVWRSVAEAGSRLGIEMAVIKGIALESRFFDRTGERPCTDLDVLIDPSGVERLEGLLLELGVGPDRAARSARLVKAGRIQSVPIWVDDVSVDLHADLFKLGFASRDPDAIWSSVETIAGDEGPIRSIDAAVSLLHVLIHLNRDRFRRLLGYVDIHRVANSELVDWDRFWAHARREGLESIAHEVLIAVDQVVPLQVPGLGNRPTTLRGWVWRRFWPPQTRLTGREGRYRFGRRAQIVLPLLCKGRALEAIACLSKSLFPPAELLAYNHPGLAEAPYLLRLARARTDDRRTKRRNQNLETVGHGSHSE